jgi:hypothetical protein
MVRVISNHFFYAQAEKKFMYGAVIVPFIRQQQFPARLQSAPQHTSPAARRRIYG